MRNLWLLILLCLAAGVAILAPSVYAASSPVAPKDPCNLPDGDLRLICAPIAKSTPPPSTPVPASPIAPSKGVLPYTYAYVTTGPIALYANPADAERGAAPIRALDTGYIWVRLTGWIVYKGRIWYLTDGGGYLPASITAIYRPSSLQGIIVRNQPAFPFAWVLTSIKTSSKPGAKPGANPAAFKRYDVVNIYEQRKAGDLTWYRVGDNQWIIQTVVAKVEWTPRPPGVGPDEKWIDVSLFEQTVAAYQGDRMVYAALASTGLRRWPTAQGLYRIYSKITLGPMAGQEGLPDYYSLEDVPWAMYFYQGYSLHGTYWHDGFGYRHSHGCINLAPLDAKWLYDWTTPVVAQGSDGQRATKNDPGTWVWVHD